MSLNIVVPVGARPLLNEIVVGNVDAEIFCAVLDRDCKPMAMLSRKCHRIETLVREIF